MYNGVFSKYLKPVEGDHCFGTLGRADFNIGRDYITDGGATVYETDTNIVVKSGKHGDGTFVPVPQGKDGTDMYNAIVAVVVPLLVISYKHKVIELPSVFEVISFEESRWNGTSETYTVIVMNGNKGKNFLLKATATPDKKGDTNVLNVPNVDNRVHIPSGSTIVSRRPLTNEEHIAYAPFIASCKPETRVLWNEWVEV